LRITIIVMFFLGGVTGGVLFEHFGIRSLILGSLILVGGLLYDFIKIRFLLLKRNA